MRLGNVISSLPVAFETNWKHISDFRGVQINSDYGSFEILKA